MTSANSGLVAVLAVAGASPLGRKHLVAMVAGSIGCQAGALLLLNGARTIVALDRSPWVRVTAGLYHRALDVMRACNALCSATGMQSGTPGTSEAAGAAGETVAQMSRWLEEARELCTHMSVLWAEHLLTLPDAPPPPPPPPVSSSSAEEGGRRGWM